METITKIIRAKEKKKTVEIPEKFLNKDIRVTIETVNEPERKYSAEEIIKHLNELRKKTQQIKIPKNIDVDDMIDEMNS